MAFIIGVHSDSNIGLQRSESERSRQQIVVMLDRNTANLRADNSDDEADDHDVYTSDTISSTNYRQRKRRSCRVLTHLQYYPGNINTKPYQVNIRAARDFTKAVQDRHYHVKNVTAQNYTNITKSTPA